MRDHPHSQWLFIFFSSAPLRFGQTKTPFPEIPETALYAAGADDRLSAGQVRRESLP